MAAVKLTKARLGKGLKQALRFIFRSPLSMVVFIVLGLLCGLYVPELAYSLTPFSDVYLNLLKMVVLPFLVSSIIFSIRAMISDPNTAGYLARISFAVVTVAVLSVAVSGTLALFLEPGHISDPQSRIELGKVINSQGTVSSDLDMSLYATDEADVRASPLSVLLQAVPSNVFNALASGDTIQVLLFCLIFGIAIGRIPHQTSASLADALDAIYRTCIILTDWFIWLLPLATFVMIAEQTATIGIEPLRLMAGFLMVMGLSALTFIMVSLALISISAKCSYWTAFRTFQPLLMIAITTRSSIACIPWITSPLVGKLKFENVVVELLVPLQSALLRVGPILFYVTGIIFIAQLYGRTLSTADLVLIGFSSSLLGLTTAGMSGMVIISQLSILCGYLGLPFEAAFVLFIAVDTVTDAFMTLSSVFAVAAATAVIAPHAEADEDTPAQLHSDDVYEEVYETAPELAPSSSLTN